MLKINRVIYNKKMKQSYFISDCGMVVESTTENFYAILSKGMWGKTVYEKWHSTFVNNINRIDIIDTKNHLKRVQLESTLKCNLFCEHCYCNASMEHQHSLHTNEIISLIDQAADMGVIYFDITGGEAILRKDVYEILSHANNKGMITSVFSNGTTLNEDRIKKLKESKLGRIQISIDSIEDDVRDRIRGKKGSLRKTIENILILKKYDIPISVTSCLSESNVDSYVDTIKFIEKELRLAVNVDRVVTAGRAISSLDEKIEFEIMKSINIDASIGVKKCGVGAISKNNIEPYCGVGSSYLFITNEGIAAICPTLSYREGDAFRCKSVLTYSLNEVWENDEVINGYRGVQCSNIQVCPSAEICQGGCRSNAFLKHGSVLSPDEYNCNIHKNKTSQYIKYIDDIYSKEIIEVV